MGFWKNIFGKKDDAKETLEHPKDSGHEDEKLAHNERLELDHKKKEEKKETKHKEQLEKKKQKQIREFREAVSRFHKLKVANGSIVTKYISLRKKGKHFSPKGIAQKYNTMYNILFEKMFDSEGHVVGIHDLHYQAIIGKLRHPYNEILEFIRELRSKSIDEIDKKITEHHMKKIHEAEHAIQEGIMMILHNQNH